MTASGFGNDPDWIVNMQPGEQVLWTGRPSRQPIVFSCGDIFSVPFFGMFFYLTSTELLGEIGTLEPEDGIMGLFVVVTGYMSFGKFIHNWWRRSRTRYALTDRRALIRTGPIRLRTHSFPLRTLASVDSQLRPDGSGTIIFTDHPGLAKKRSGSGTPIENVAGQGLDHFQFFKVPQAEYVMSLINHATAQPDLPTEPTELIEPTDGAIGAQWAPRPTAPRPAPPPSLRDIPPPPGFDR